MNPTLKTFPCKITIEQWRAETDAIHITSVRTGRTLSRYRWQDRATIQPILDKVDAPHKGNYGCKDIAIDLSAEEMRAFKNFGQNLRPLPGNLRG